jgi:hypothetical protein
LFNHLEKGEALDSEIDIKRFLSWIRGLKGNIACF